MTRMSLYIDEELVKEVKEIADNDTRSVSFVISSLLRQAIKERLRQKAKNSKRKGATENNS